MYPIINDKLKNTPYKISLAVTGGGTGAIDKILKYGGGSSTLIDAYVPYDIDRLQEFLTHAPDKCCSIDTARAMAMEAYIRARNSNDPSKVLGVGATCKLRKVVNERLGREHTIHIAIQGEEFTESFDFILGPTASTVRIREMGRVEEEDLCSDTIIMCIAIASGLEEYHKPLKEIYGDDYTHFKAVDRANIKDVLFGPRKATAWLEDGLKAPAPCIFSGSFNPIHEGHIEMIKIAKEKYGSVDLEISIHNAAKGLIDYQDIIIRIAEILKLGDLINNIWFSDLPMFSKKGDYFPNSTFIIGGDTLVRIDDKKYYGKHDIEQTINRTGVFQGFTTNNINFLVFLRKGYDIKDVSPKLMEKCIVVKPKVYKDNGISSTQIREGK